MVTAEMAVIAPFGIVFAFLLVWVVALGLTQVQLTDAAREAARLVARGESVGAAEDVARRGAPAGASVRVERSDGLVTVRVSVRRGMPFLPHAGSRRLTASAVSAQEDP